ncbi:MAG: Holliday junction resolvase RuvX [Pseudomonadota bacterium]
MHNILAFDYGLKRIGVAVGSLDTKIATAISTIINKKDGPDWGAINNLILEWQPKILLVGVPALHKDAGEHNTLLKQIDLFCESLKDRFSLPVETCNEDFSSTEAYSLLKMQRAQGHKKKIERQEIDKLAAAIILQCWLNQ